MATTAGALRRGFHLLHHFKAACGRAAQVQQQNIGRGGAHQRHRLQRRVGGSGEHESRQVCDVVGGGGEKGGTAVGDGDLEDTFVGHAQAA